MMIPNVLILGVKLSALTSNNRFISLSTRLASLGIMLGVATLITVIAVMRGFESEIKQSLVNKVDHLQVQSFDHEYPDDFIQALERKSGVVNVYGFYQEYALIKVNKRYMPVMIMAIDDARPIKGFPEFEKEGVYLSHADQWLFKPGTKLPLIVPQKDRIKPKIVSPVLLGHYTQPEMGNKMMTIYLSMSTYQSLLGKVEPSGLNVTVDDLYATGPVKSFIREHYVGRYFATDWQDRYEAFFSALRLQRSVMVFVLSMITLVALFSLISGLVMMSSDKIHEIALLRTIGVSKWQITQIFMIQGVFISGVGIVLGCLMAHLLCQYAHEITHFIEWLIAGKLVDARIYGTSELPTDYSLLLMLQVSGFSLFFGVLASIIPALKAASINPAKVLRYG